MVSFFFQKLQVFIRWPLLSLLALQILLSLSIEYPTAPCVALFMCLSGMVLVALFFYHQRKLAISFICILFISFLWHQMSLKHLSEYVFEKRSEYKAVVVDVPTVRDGLSRVAVDLKERLKPLASRVSGRVMITVGDACYFGKGDMILFSTSIKQPFSFQNPGGFNYLDYLQRKNIWAKGFVEKCEAIQLLQRAKQGWLATLREKILYPIQSSNKLNHGPVLSALILGTRTLGIKYREVIRESGLSHLFAISGTHFGIMCAFIYFLASLLTTLMPKVYLLIPKQKIAAFLTLVFVVFYMSLVEPRPSIMRAGTMLMVYLLSVLISRQKNILHIILVSASIILFLKPLEVFSVSFQLSYLSVLTLAIVYPPIYKWFLKHHQEKKVNLFISYAIQICLVSWLLNFMLLPIILMEFGSLPLSAFINNIWAVPYFQFVVIPLTLLYLFCSLLLPSLASIILTVWDEVLNVFFKVLEYFQSIELGEISVFVPHWEHLLLFYALIFLFFLTKSKRLVLVFSGILCLFIARTYYHHFIDYDLRITQMDVRHGDAILIQTKAKNIMIDSGGNRYFDVGKNVVLPFLGHKWIDRLDYVILSHSDIDHFGSVIDLLDSISIGEIWINDLPVDDPAYHRLIDAALSKKIPLRIIYGKHIFSLGTQTFLTVMSPFKETQKFLNDNDHSIVVKLDHGDFSALFTGDISSKVEEVLIQEYKDELQATVLKVSHHGSHTSTSSRFLDVVQPKIATIGVENNSRYGHPHQSVLNRLGKRGITILRTDKHGAVGIDIKEGMIRTWKFID